MKIVVPLSLFLILTACAPELTATSPAPAKPPAKTTQQSLSESGAADKRDFVLVTSSGGNSLTRLVARDHLVYSFTYAVNRVYFTLKNTDIYPVTILWDKSTMTDADGATGGLYHDKIALAKVKEPQKNTLVEPGNTYEDFFAPATLVVPNAKNTGLMQKPLLTGVKDSRTFTVNLALEVNGQPLVHTFSFKKIINPNPAK
ncbi:hypothetical protein [Deinococcus roseus]|uniref:DUF3124 domain-containing protein n=1 Tax=Deinococcus roseus TaxID=392414 RepID=A0ABQ2D183_9DEIO|nr:hypothetical protein [Deinococcus roseus]GGJ34623.1 hypothetical protein GCM10008938_21010 [Deinococcus roseus]